MNNTDKVDDQSLRTIEDAMKFLSCSRTYIYTLARQKKLELVKLGSATRVTQRSLNDFTQELRRTSPFDKNGE